MEADAYARQRSACSGALLHFEKIIVAAFLDPLQTSKHSR